MSISCKQKSLYYVHPNSSIDLVLFKYSNLYILVLIHIRAKHELWSLQDLDMIAFMTVYSYCSKEPHHYLGHLRTIAHILITFWKDEIACWILLAIV